MVVAARVRRVSGCGERIRANLARARCRQAGGSCPGMGATKVGSASINFTPSQAKWAVCSRLASLAAGACCMATLLHYYAPCHPARDMGQVQSKGLICLLIHGSTLFTPATDSRPPLIIGDEVDRLDGRSRWSRRSRRSRRPRGNAPCSTPAQNPPLRLCGCRKRVAHPCRRPRPLPHRQLARQHIARHAHPHAAGLAPCVACHEILAQVSRAVVWSGSGPARASRRCWGCRARG
jgi:hypothetical protein